MKNGAILVSKELNIMLLFVIGLLVIVMLVLWFGWGKTPNQNFGEAEQRLELLRQQQPGMQMFPEGEVQGRAQPEIEVQGVPGAQGRRVGLGFPTQTDIGLTIYPIDQWTQDRLGLKTADGVVVNSVASGSMAAGAGLQAQDVIISVGKWEVENVSDFKNIEAKLLPGDRYKIRFIRDGNKESGYLVVYDAKAQAAALAAAAKQVWLGADVQNIDELIQNQFGLRSRKGTIVGFVEAGSPAETAGIRQGDVIQEVDGKKVKTITDLQELIAARKPGDRVQLSIIRENEVVTPFVTLAVKPVLSVEKPPMLPGAEVEVEAAWIGLDLEPLTKAEVEEMNLPPGTQGMVVAAVAAESPGEKAGAKIGDVILAVNGMPLKSLQVFQEATENANGAVLDVLRAGRHLYLTIQPPTAFGGKPGQPGGLMQIARTGSTYKKIAIVSSGTTLFDQVSPDFEKCPYIIIYNPNDGSSEAIQNPDFQNPGALCHLILERRLTAVITGRIDPNFKALLMAENVTVYTGVFGHLYQAVQMYRDNRLVRSDADTGDGRL